MALNVATRIVTRPREGPTKIEADVCVVGSGSAGFSAALTAAELGKRVVLVDAMPMVGGQAVGTLLGTLCGFYSNGPDPYRVTYGTVSDLFQTLARDSVLSPRRARNSVILLYDDAALGRWVERSIEKAGVTLLLGAVLRAADMVDRRVSRLHVATRWGEVEIEADGFVDASGDAALAWLAGLPVREPEAPVYGTQMVTIENMNEAELGKMSRWEMQAILEEKAEDYGLIRKDGFVFALPGRGVGIANMTHIETPTDPVGASGAGLAGKEQADKLLTFLQSEFPAALGEARIRAYGLPGIRQTRWIVGAHHLTMEDVRSGERPDDAVARCTWPIELHNEASGVYWEEFGDDHMHYVPLRCMTPEGADNIVAAGRCADGDVGALASVRVMGPCMAMGQAAAHALDLAGSGSVHQLDFGALAGRLKDNLERRDRDPWARID